LRQLAGRSPSSYESACLRACSSLKDNFAAITFEVIRGMNILRHLAMTSSITSPDLLESSLEPRQIIVTQHDSREGSILIPAGTSTFWNHRLSFDKYGARSRPRAVSFSAAASDEDEFGESSTDADAHSRQVPPSPPAVVMLPNGSTPVPSTPSDSPRSSIKSPRSTPSLSRSPSPTGVNDTLQPLKHEDTPKAPRTDADGSEYDRIDYYPDPMSGKEAYLFLKDVDRIEQLQHEITRRNSSGVFTDDEQRHVQERQAAVDGVKQDMIDHICGGGVITLHSVEDDGEEDEAVTRFEDFFNDIVLSTDINPVNLKLVRSIADAWRQGRIRSNVSLLQLCERRGLIAAACVDGSFGYLRTLLNLYRIPPSWGTEVDLPEVDNGENGVVNIDVSEVLSSAMFNQLQRMSLVNVLLQYTIGDAARKWYPALARAFAEGVVEVRHEINEFCNDICNAKKILPKEDRTKRNELIRRMAVDGKDVLPLDWMDEGADDQTRLSRACRDGDGDLVQLFIDLLPTETVRMLVTRVQPDNMTALIHAVISGSKACVASLVSVMRTYLEDFEGGRDAVKACLQHVSPDAGGSALQLCRLLKRDASIEVDIESLQNRVDSQPCP